MSLVSNIDEYIENDKGEKMYNSGNLPNTGAALGSVGAASVWGWVGLAVGLVTVGYVLLASKNLLPTRRGK